MRLGQSKFSLSLILLLFIGSGSWRSALAAESVVIQWNNAALRAVRNTRLGPTIVARALAVAHTSMFAAWAAYDPIAISPHLRVPLRRPPAEHTLANKEAAVSYAAYRALLDLFPSQEADLTSLMRDLGYDPAALSTDPATPSGVGNAAAASVLAFRHRDGSNQLADLHPGAYSDYTYYQPSNSHDLVLDPDRWQPLRLPSGQVQQFLTPHWGRVIPFALASGSQIQPERPPAFFGHQAFGWAYRRQALELLHLSAELTDREKMIAEYWSDGPATETPPGHWCLLAQFASRRDGHDLDQDVKMFFALTNANLDASIAVWDCKRTYDYVRPITAIRHLFRGRRVRAWAGPFLGTRYVFGEDWQPYQLSSFVTPPFGEYVSGHSTFSAASAEILKSFTGSDDFGASVTLPAGSSRIEPRLVPATEITLSWATFTEAADEAGKSRRYGGIHFPDGDLQGRIMGRRIGALVWQQAQAYWQ